MSLYNPRKRVQTTPGYIGIPPLPPTDSLVAQKTCNFFFERNHQPSVVSHFHQTTNYLGVPPSPPGQRGILRSSSSRRSTTRSPSKSVSFSPSVKSSGGQRKRRIKIERTHPKHISERTNRPKSLFQTGQQLQVSNRPSNTSREVSASRSSRRRLSGEQSRSRVQSRSTSTLHRKHSRRDGRYRLSERHERKLHEYRRSRSRRRRSSRVAAIWVTMWILLIFVRMCTIPCGVGTIHYFEIVKKNMMGGRMLQWNIFNDNIIGIG